MIWIPIWKMVLVIALGLFCIVSVAVIIGGIIELKKRRK